MSVGYLRLVPELYLNLKPKSRYSYNPEPVKGHSSTYFWIHLRPWIRRFAA